MQKRDVGFRWFALLGCSAAALVVGCGDDDGVTPPNDGGEDSATLGPTCPAQAPDPESLSGACCYRSSNADQLANPELRLAALVNSSPASLSLGLVSNLIQVAMNEERFNWIIQIEGAEADGPVTIRTGLGLRSPDGTFAFADGSAPDPSDAGADPLRWDPAELSGQLTGETVTSEPLGEPLLLPIFDPSNALLTELPLQQVQLTRAELSENRSCIGERLQGRYDTADGEIVAFIRVDDAAERTVVVESLLNTDLCVLLAGNLADQGTPCAEIPRADWNSKPDSLCDEEGCEVNDPDDTNVCDPLTTCNAWHVVAHIAAQGVSITN